MDGRGTAAGKAFGMTADISGFKRQDGKQEMSSDAMPR